MSNLPLKFLDWLADHPRFTMGLLMVVYMVFLGATFAIGKQLAANLHLLP